MVATRLLWPMLLSLVVCATALLLVYQSSLPEATQGGVKAWLPVPYTKDMGDAELNALLDKAADAGADGVETQADWGQLEPSNETYHWTYMDRFVDHAEERGLEVGMQITAAPRWISPEGMWYPPRTEPQLAHWHDFVGALVGRYGTRVTRYEMWNEPNHPTFWAGGRGPSPEEYAALLREGYLAANAANSSVGITGGMLSHNDIGYLNALYDELRKFPDAAANDDFFDELAVHPYSRKGTTPLAPGSALEVTFRHDFGPRNTNFWGFRYMRDVLVERGDGHKKLYLGEFGYNTKAAAAYADPVTDAQRADWLKRAFAIASQNSSYVSGLDWFSYYTAADDGYNIVDPSTQAESLTFKAFREVNSESTALTFSSVAGAREVK